MIVTNHHVILIKLLHKNNFILIKLLHNMMVTNIVTYEVIFNNISSDS